MIGLPEFPIVLALATAVVAGLVGSVGLMKKMTLAGDVVSHLALPGLGVALLWRVNPITGAAFTLAAGIALIHYLDKRGGLATETAIGVVFVASLAAGAVLTPREDLMEALFGGFTPVTRSELAFGLIACAGVLTVLHVVRHKLMMTIFSPDVARAMKINVDRVNLIYLCAFGVTVLLGLRFLGALLAGAMIIVPAATARRLTSSLNHFVALSVAASVLSAATGFFLARYLHVAPGPAIAGAATALFTGAALHSMYEPS